MTTPVIEHLKYGRRLTRAQRGTCRKSDSASPRGQPRCSIASVAQRLQCHRDAVRRWMCGTPGSLPGPRPGEVRKPLSDAQKARARDYRKQGMSIPSLARALSEDFPGSRVTEHQMRRLKRAEGWPDLRPKKTRGAHKPFDKTSPGFLHIDAIVGPNPADPVVFTARERSSRLGFAIATEKHNSAAAAQFLDHVISTSPLKIHTILTDNGSEFMKDFVAAVASTDIVHKHTRPRRPQTNGMVERFNGLLKEGVVATDSAWWHRCSADNNTDWEKIQLERFNIPLPNRRLRRMQRDLNRYLLWMNVIKPNPQLAWKTPLEWLKNLDTEEGQKDQATSFQRRPSTMIPEEKLYQISKGLGGQRYLPKPPPDWP